MMNFRGKSTHFHGCDWSHVVPNQSQNGKNNWSVHNYHLSVSLTHAQMFKPALRSFSSTSTGILHMAGTWHVNTWETRCAPTQGVNSTHTRPTDNWLYHSHNMLCSHMQHAEMPGAVTCQRDGKAVYLKRSCPAAFGGTSLTRDFRRVGLTPRVSGVWSCITNIWMHSREGGGISGYRGYIQGA